MITWQPVDRGEKASQFLEEKIARVFGYQVDVPLEKGRMELRPAARMDEALIEGMHSDFGYFFPVAEVYDNACADFGGRRVTFSDRGGGRSLPRSQTSGTAKTPPSRPHDSDMVRDRLIAAKPSNLGLTGVC